MDWRLFFSTFILIFLAELGDKTQLTAMAQSAGNRSPWLIFSAASFALVLSTFIAVFAGSFLRSLIPPHYIQLMAGILFLVFGVALVYNFIRTPAPAQEETEAATPQPAKTDFITRLALQAAHDFEKASIDDYLSWSEKTDNPALKTVLLEIAKEEEAHLGHILQQDWQAPDIKKPEEDKLAETPQKPDYSTLDADGIKILKEAIRHEEDLSHFYRSLSEKTHIPAMQKIFTKLSAEEMGHAQKLKQWLN